MKRINRYLYLIFVCLFGILFLCGCEINSEEVSSVEDKISEEINYIEDKILTFYSMYAKDEYSEVDNLNWDLIEENVIDLNRVLDTVILDMSEVEISNEDIIVFKDSILPTYARKSF